MIEKITSFSLAIILILGVDNRRMFDAFLGVLYSARELTLKKCDEISRLVGAGTCNEYVAVNTHGHSVTEYVRLYITSEAGVNAFRLTDKDGREIPYQITPTQI